MYTRIHIREYGGARHGQHKGGRCQSMNKTVVMYAIYKQTVLSEVSLTSFTNKLCFPKCCHLFFLLTFLFHLLALAVS